MKFDKQIRGARWSDEKLDDGGREKERE